MSHKNTPRCFAQHTMETCGEACILMVLDHFRKIRYATVQMEHSLYHHWRCQSYAGTLPLAAAACLGEYGLNRKLYLSGTQLENRNGFFPEAMHRGMVAEVPGQPEGFTCIPNATVDTNLLKAELDQGNLVMAMTRIPGASWYQQMKHKDLLLTFGMDDALQGDVESCLQWLEDPDADTELCIAFPGALDYTITLRGTPAELKRFLFQEQTIHWVVVYGYDDHHFKVIDPLSGKLLMTYPELDTYMDSPFGRLILTAGQ
ncbi:MAG: hypothetical protein IKU68_07180 [Oscillospiraceae bacterium]|nr:hypothetical protein [Oscillospiraceae bacterium]